VLKEGRWELLDGMRNLANAQQPGASAVLEDVALALTTDEYILRLQPKVRELEDQASRVFTRLSSSLPAVPPPGTAPVVQPATVPPPPQSQPPVQVLSQQPGWRVVGEAHREKLDHAAAKKAVDELLQRLAANPQQRADLTWRLYGPEKGG